MSVVYLKTPNQTIFAYSPSGVFYVGLRLPHPGMKEDTVLRHHLDSYLPKMIEIVFPAETSSLCAENTRDKLHEVTCLLPSSGLPMPYGPSLQVGLAGDLEGVWKNTIDIPRHGQFRFSQACGDADDYLDAFVKAYPR